LGALHFSIEDFKKEGFTFLYRMDTLQLEEVGREYDSMLAQAGYRELHTSSFSGPGGVPTERKIYQKMTRGKTPELLMIVCLEGETDGVRQSFYGGCSGSLQLSPNPFAEIPFCCPGGIRIRSLDLAKRWLQSYFEEHDLIAQD
jgi:hypothetical protein